MSGGKAALVLMCRCRYLEESGCVSVCVNSCKLPTQVCRHPALPGPMHARRVAAAFRHGLLHGSPLRGLG